MRIDLSGQSFDFPDSCACCHGIADRLLPIPATKSSGKRVIHTEQNVWDVPYCDRCLGHFRAAESARSLARGLTISSVLGGVVIGYFVNTAIGIIIGILGVVAAVFLHSSQMDRARAMCSANCACVGRAIAYLGWHGPLHQFEIMSSRFAGELMAANPRKLVNLSPQARSLLESMPMASSTTRRTPRRYRS
jgi:hypothetical protein